MSDKLWFHIKIIFFNKLISSVHLYCFAQQPVSYKTVNMTESNNPNSTNILNIWTIRACELHASCFLSSIIYEWNSYFPPSFIGHMSVENIKHQFLQLIIYCSHPNIYFAFLYQLFPWGFIIIFFNFNPSLLSWKVSHIFSPHSIEPTVLTSYKLNYEYSIVAIRNVIKCINNFLIRNKRFLELNFSLLPFYCVILNNKYLSCT